MTQLYNGFSCTIRELFINFPLLYSRGSSQRRGDNTLDITDVIKKVQKGDFEAFEYLIKLQGPKALKTAYLITGEKHIAEECVQEAFLQCYQKIYQLKNPQVFESWFYRILTRICWGTISKNKNNVSLEALKEAGQDFHSEKDNTEEIEG